jgi:hypothetical protein
MRALERDSGVESFEGRAIVSITSSTASSPTTAGISVRNHDEWELASMRDRLRE